MKNFQRALKSPFQEETMQKWGWEKGNILIGRSPFGPKTIITTANMMKTANAISEKRIHRSLLDSSFPIPDSEASSDV
jgi:hypothetical protein